MNNFGFLHSYHFIVSCSKVYFSNLMRVIECMQYFHYSCKYKIATFTRLATCIPVYDLVNLIPFEGRLAVPDASSWTNEGLQMGYRV